MLLRGLVTLSSFFLLVGCASQQQGFATFQGSTAAIHTPQFAVRGRTNYDQVWINRTTEALVDSGQPRPLPRPARLDAPPSKVAVNATAITVKTSNSALVAKRKRWFGY